MTLPPPAASPLREVLAARRSTKSYRPEALGADQLAGLLRDCLGATAPGGRRYASAHARYAVLATVLVGAVPGVPAGVYDWDGDPPVLRLRAAGDHRAALAAATIDAPWLVHCPVVLALSAALAEEDRHFREQGHRRGSRFAAVEAGMAAQNVYLWAAALGYGTAYLGGLDDDLASGAGPVLPAGHSLLGLLPVGHPAAQPR